METVTEYAQLRAHITSLSSLGIVAVEGFIGSGKSFLANTLAKDLSAVAIHTDEYVCGTDGALPYPERLTYANIIWALNSASASDSLIIVEGICLREVLRRSGVKANFFIYVKSIARNGLWHDGLHLEDFENEAETDAFRQEPRRSDWAYHAKARPHERADIMFHRVEVDIKA